MKVSKEYELRVFCVSLLLTFEKYLLLNWRHGNMNYNKYNGIKPEPHIEVGSQNLPDHIRGLWNGHLPIPSWCTIPLCHSLPLISNNSWFKGWVNVIFCLLVAAALFKGKVNTTLFSFWVFFLALKRSSLLKAFAFSICSICCSELHEHQ